MSAPRTSHPLVRFGLAVGVTGILLIAIFGGLVIRLRSDLRNQIRTKIIERDAAVLYPMALQQLAESDNGGPLAATASVSALLTSARQKGMLAVAVFDADGSTLQAVPSNQLFVELPPEDFLRLQSSGPLSRFHPAFPLDQYFAGVAPDQREAPVLEVLLPLPAAAPGPARGFVRYFIDARPLAAELAEIDRRVDRQTAVTLGVGTALIALVMSAAAFAVWRAQQAVAERNSRLMRANFELTLAAKASAVGQITSHLIHGLQGSVEGLRAAVGGRGTSEDNPDWPTAAEYAQRLQTMIRETIALLGDTNAQASYEVSGRELAILIRERNDAFARERGAVLLVSEGFPETMDSHRGSLLCLIANNLAQNAVFATKPGRRVWVTLALATGEVVLMVQDEGPGIPAGIREHLFQPGRTGRQGGSGLGLAISRLIARQIGAELELVSSGPDGTLFRLVMPLVA